MEGSGVEGVIQPQPDQGTREIPPSAPPPVLHRSSDWSPAAGLTPWSGRRGKRRVDPAKMQRRLRVALGRVGAARAGGARRGSRALLVP